MLVGPFDSTQKAAGVAANQFVPPSIWVQLANACHKYGLVPLDLSVDLTMITNTVSICYNSHIIPWYHSSFTLGEVVRRSLS